MENDVMGEKLQLLYDAMESLGASKILEDSFQAKLMMKEVHELQLIEKISIQEVQISKLIDDNQEILDLLQQAQTSNKRLMDQREKIQLVLRESTQKLQKERDQAQLERNEKIEELSRLTKQMQVLITEREKFKVKLLKLKKRKNIDFNQKTCRNCGQDFVELENYNWSCRTHRSEFGGEMWWCCGKHHKDAPGCKYTKHITKDEDEDDGFLLEGEIKKRLKGLKCFCCKETGHKTENCTKDPNMRQNCDLDDELIRITERKSARKLNGDSFEVSNKLMEKLSKQKLHSIFGKDIMSFDDYNYKLVNEAVFNVQGSTFQSDDDISSISSDDEENSQFDPNLEHNKLRQQIMNGKRKQLFNKNQIEEIIENQNKDTFEKLVQVRHETTIDNLNSQNFVDLNEVVSKMMQDKDNLRSKSIKASSLHSGGNNTQNNSSSVNVNNLKKSSFRRKDTKYIQQKSQIQSYDEQDEDPFLNYDRIQKKQEVSINIQGSNFSNSKSESRIPIAGSPRSPRKVSSFNKGFKLKLQGPQDSPREIIVEYASGQKEKISAFKSEERKQSKVDPSKFKKMQQFLRKNSKIRSQSQNQNQSSISSNENKKLTRKQKEKLKQEIMLAQLQEKKKTIKTEKQLKQMTLDQQQDFLKKKIVEYMKKSKKNNLQKLPLGTDMSSFTQLALINQQPVNHKVLTRLKSLTPRTNSKIQDESKNSSSKKRYSIAYSDNVNLLSPRRLIVNKSKTGKLSERDDFENKSSKSKSRKKSKGNRKKSSKKIKFKDN
eukprot:403362455